MEPSTLHRQHQPLVLLLGLLRRRHRVPLPIGSRPKRSIISRSHPGILSDPAMHVDDIAAANAAYRELAMSSELGPFRLDKLRDAVSAALAAAPNPALIQQRWAKIDDIYVLALSTSLGIPHAVMLRRLQVDPALIALWAGYGALISIALDELQHIVEASIAEFDHPNTSPQPPTNDPPPSPEPAPGATSQNTWLSVDEFAVYRACSPDAVRAWCREGMPHSRNGRGKTSPIRIRRDEADAWLSSQSQTTTNATSTQRSTRHSGRQTSAAIQRFDNQGRRLIADDPKTET